MKKSKMIRKNVNRRSKKKSLAFFLIIIIIILFFNLFSTFNLFTQRNSHYNDKKLKFNGLWASIELTNPGEVNNSLFTHSALISVKGRLYNKINASVDTSGINVAIEVNDIMDMGYTDITDIDGNFSINYIINPLLDVYTAHKIEVMVTDTGLPGDIEYLDFYMINVNATSYFDIISNDNPSTPKLTEEIFNLNGYLNYDNNIGISFESVNYYWLNGSMIVSQGSFFTDGTGTLTSLQVPITVASQLSLKFNYTNPPFVGYSETTIPNIKVFSDVTWNLIIDYTVTEGDDYTLTGTLSSSTNSSLKIGNRDLDIYYNGSVIDTVMTASDGTFSSTFPLLQNGTASIQVELINSAGKTITSTIQYIVVENRPVSPGGGAALPPFMIFSLIFFPILIGIIVGLVVYGFFFYKKQEEESRVVNIALESKISNLKILKDTGRLEESLSYLFNAIYMDLVRAKYNRFRKENETIRDFAIISVKDLKLTPSSIYPFIQQVEEIIYGKPYKITEKDFYKTCELFSPIYFQLTGYNFVLNF